MQRRLQATFQSCDPPYDLAATVAYALLAPVYPCLALEILVALLKGCSDAVSGGLERLEVDVVHIAVTHAAPKGPLRAGSVFKL